MTQDIKTLELAKIYESQGHYIEAYNMYLYLNDQKPSDEIKDGVKRMEKMMKNEVHSSHPEEKISRLIEQWLMLMVLKQRLNNFKKIRSRLL